MTTQPEPLRRRDRSQGGEHYLESTVRSASPARMRLMLIQRGVDVAGCLSSTWRSKQDLGANQHWIKLLDLFNELLGGVVGGKTESENAVCQKVADLYVFLSKHLVAAETTSNADSIDEIKAVLEVEAETWRAVCALELPNRDRAGIAGGVENAGGLNLEA